MCIRLRREILLISKLEQKKTKNPWSQVMCINQHEKKILKAWLKMEHESKKLIGEEVNQIEQNVNLQTQVKIIAQRLSQFSAANFLANKEDN